MTNLCNLCDERIYEHEILVINDSKAYHFTCFNDKFTVLDNKELIDLVAKLVDNRIELLKEKK